VLMRSRSVIGATAAVLFLLGAILPRASSEKRNVCHNEASDGRH
jgi:hypothetical protein